MTYCMALQISHNNVSTVISSAALAQLKELRLSSATYMQTGKVGESAVIKQRHILLLPVLVQWLAALLVQVTLATIKGHAKVTLATIRGHVNVTMVTIMSHVKGTLAIFRGHVKVTMGTVTGQ